MVVPNRFSRAVSKRRSSRPSKPARQGDYDGLCGVYAVINTIRLLLPRMTVADGELLFAYLLAKISKRNRSSETIVWDGTDHQTLEAMVNLASRYLQQQTLPRLTIETPFRRRRCLTLSAVWLDIRKGIEDGAVVILGLYGPINHWTVVVGVTRTRLKLFDSDGMTNLHRETCTIGQGRRRHRINPRDVFFVRRTTNSKSRRTL
jgi:hypothetical protein